MEIERLICIICPNSCEISVHISGKKDISLSTRVLEPGREKKIIVKSKNRILKEIFKRKVNPAEMIRFELRK